MNTADKRNATPATDFNVANPNAFALWRMRSDALYFRPEAWDSVERLKLACAAEPRRSRLEAMSEPDANPKDARSGVIQTQCIEPGKMGVG
jgi:hypothetical protein